MYLSANLFVLVFYDKIVELLKLKLLLNHCALHGLSIDLFHEYPHGVRLKTHSEKFVFKFLLIQPELITSA